MNILLWNATTDWIFCTAITMLTEILNWNIYTDWIFCIEISVINEYFALKYHYRLNILHRNIYTDWNIKLKYIYWLNTLYWHISNDCIFWIEISLMKKYSALNYLYWLSLLYRTLPFGFCICYPYTKVEVCRAWVIY